MPQPLGQPNQEQMESPGLGAGHGQGAAFEVKYQLSEQEAREIEGWARQNLIPDGYGDRGTYRVTSVYCDTPHLDVFHRSPGYRRSKYRVRRYDQGGPLFLEQKTKKGDRVRKKRVEVSPEELAFLLADEPPLGWHGEWFGRRVREKNLRPTCGLSYVRTAFFGQSESGPIRMTFDREVVGSPAEGWGVPTVENGRGILSDGVLLEMKFHIHLPVLFRDLLPRLPAAPSRFSKYRQGVKLCELEGMNILPAPLPSRNGEAHRDAS